jgi:Uma2 family endonuclease
MVALKTMKNRKLKPSTIPAALIYEIIDGKPIYYNGYKAVLKGEKTIDDTIITGVRQTRMLNAIQGYLQKKHADTKLTIFVGEIGIHISTNNNFSCDLVIFEDAVLNTLENSNKYFPVPPKIIVEVDTDADLSEVNFVRYMLSKTKKLLNFGVEKVVWVFSEYQKVMIAVPNGDWITRDWDKDIEILDGDSVNLAELFKSKGIHFELPN